MRRFALMAALVGMVCSAAGEVTVTAKQSECLPPVTDPEQGTIDVEVKDCVLYIYHRGVVTNCCLEYTPKVEIDGSVIRVTEIDSGPPCDCICPFDLEIAIEGLEPGMYVINMVAFLHPDPISITVEIPSCDEFWLIGAEVWSTMGIAGVEVPIYATNPRPLEGFSFGTTYPLEHAIMNDVTLDGTVTEEAGAEFFVYEIQNESADGRGWTTVAVVLDTDPPFDRQTIPPGTDQHIVTLVYDILPPSGSVPRSISVPLVDGLGSPAIKLIFSVAGQDLVPQVERGIIQISMPAPTFIRGDANDNGDITIADPIYLLSYLFAKGPEPPCMDAADSNDSGDLDLADAVRTLMYLFKDGTIPPPSPPGPPGPDPTLDELGCDRIE